MSPRLIKLSLNGTHVHITDIFAKISPEMKLADFCINSALKLEDLRDHSLSALAKFSEKLIFLIP